MCIRDRSYRARPVLQDSSNRMIRVDSLACLVCHVLTDRYAGSLHSEGTSVQGGLLVDKYIRTRSSRSRSTSVSEIRHAIVRSSVLLYVTPICKCLPICVTPFNLRRLYGDELFCAFCEDKDSSSITACKIGALEEVRRGK